MNRHSSRTRPSIAAAVFLLAALAILPRPARAGDDAWGDVIDPDGDCHVVFKDGSVTCSLPGQPHGLDAESNHMNSPRVLEDVTGDFVVQVKVSGDYPVNVTTAGTASPWQGAGLLLWLDGNNYVRFERAQVVSGRQAQSYASFEARVAGEVDQYANIDAGALQGDSTYLKLERHGDKISAAVSLDGQMWSSLQPKTLHWPKTLRIGVVASHDTSTPFTAQFDGFKLTQVDASGKHNP